MRLHEFIKALEKYNCEVSIERNNYFVHYGSENEVIARIARCYVGCVYTDYARYVQLEESMQIDFFKLFAKFAATPLKDRKSWYEVVTANTPALSTKKLIVSKENNLIITFVGKQEEYNIHFWTSLFKANSKTKCPPAWVLAGIATGSLKKVYVDYDGD